MSGQKRNVAWFFTLAELIGGYYTRFVGGGISKPTESTFRDLFASVPVFKETSSAASVDTGQALENKQGLGIASSNANAKSRTNTSDGSTGGTVFIQPSHLPDVDSGKLFDDTGADNWTTVLGDDVSSITDAQKAILTSAGFNPSASAHIKIDVDTTVSTRNKYLVRLSNFFLKFLSDSIIPRLMVSGGTTGTVLKKNSSSNYDISFSNYGYKAVTTTSITIGLGSKVFGVGAGYDFAFGNRVRVTETGNVNNFVEGMVYLYSGGLLGIIVDLIGGSGSIADWQVNLAGLVYTAPVTQGDLYKGTSTSSKTIAIGSLTVITQTGLSYTTGTRVRLTSNASSSNFMEGNVTSYSGTSLVLTVDTIGGSGTLNDWNINIGGSSPLTGDVYKSTSTTSNVIGLGSLVFAVGTGYSYAIGNRIRVTDQASSANYIEGEVTAYSGGNLTILSDRIGGSGTKTAWNINLGSGVLKSAIIDIGDWNMDTTSEVTVATGLTASKMRSISVVIRDDSASSYYPLNQMDTSFVVNGGVRALGSSVILERTATGAFDNSSFDSTSYNRGWITIQYVD